jgi:hypothetical protein
MGDEMGKNNEKPSITLNNVYNLCLESIAANEGGAKWVQE